MVYRQKKAWKLYAKKRSLRYTANRVLETPSLNGAIDGYKVSVFASEHSELDARSQRRLTAIEISMHSGLPLQGAVASGGMVTVIEGLDMHQEFRPEHPKWDNSFVIRTQSNAMMQSYLTQERLDKLTALMARDKVWVVFISVDEETSLLRLDTPRALDDPKALDELVKALLEVAKTLELNKGEGKRLLKTSKASKEAGPRLDVDDDFLHDDIGFELEE